MRPSVINTDMQKFNASILTLSFITISFFVPAQNPDRILVISGGGARGAWGGGVAEYLHKNGNEYSVVIGTSTGSLMGPLVLIDSFPKLKKAYTSVTQKSIFNVNPFKTSGKNKGGLKVLNAIWRGLFYKTLGESKNLKKKIQKTITEKDYEAITSRNKEFIATVVNMTNYKVGYMSTRDYKRKDMVNWIWASGNQPVFMSMYSTKDPKNKKRKFYWQDGGLHEAVSIERAVEIAIERKIYNIDVIVHSTEFPPDTTWTPSGVLSSLTRTIDVLTQSVKDQNIQTGILLEKLQNEANGSASGSSNPFTVTLYYMLPEDYAKMENSLLFEKPIMLDLWERGASAHFDKKKYQLGETGLKKFMRKR
jgi:NTE family protein